MCGRLGPLTRCFRLSRLSLRPHDESIAVIIAGTSFSTHKCICGIAE